MSATQSFAVDPTNADAARAWDGGDGEYWAANEYVFDHSLHRYRDRFIAAASIERGARVLDIGCGNGETTRDAAMAATPAGSALGVDLSSRMLDVARQRAADAGLTNVSFLQADAQVHPFEAGAFDVAISRTGTMFFGGPVAAFTNIGRALGAGGRLVLLVWQSFLQNEWIRDFSVALAAGGDVPVPPPDAPGPFSFADPDRSTTVLHAAGFTEVTFDGVEEPMWFGGTADAAYEFVLRLGLTQYRLGSLDADARARALTDLRATIDAHADAAGVLYPSAAWLVSARRP